MLKKMEVILRPTNLDKYVTMMNSNMNEILLKDDMFNKLSDEEKRELVEFKGNMKFFREMGIYNKNYMIKKINGFIEKVS